MSISAVAGRPSGSPLAVWPRDSAGIADAGGIMPPKSTWFESKLRDAMFYHMI